MASFSAQTVAYQKRKAFCEYFLQCFHAYSFLLRYIKAASVQEKDFALNVSVGRKMSDFG